VASLVLTKPVRTAVVRGAKPALKWGGLGLVAWEGWRIWQQMKAPHAEATTEAVDPTVF
jgi:threonine/homoserine/homoserine lactone efflux protein